jgi:hypothetical protein
MVRGERVDRYAGKDVKADEVYGYEGGQQKPVAHPT